jgi:hypothetical protein
MSKRVCWQEAGVTVELGDLLEVLGEHARLALVAWAAGVLLQAIALRSARPRLAGAPI